MTPELQSTIEAVPRAVVGIDGRSAAGKSTFAGRLATTLPGATIVHGDDFYRVMREEHRAALTAPEGYDQYFDWQRLRDEVLVPARHGEFTYRLYDWNTEQLGGMDTVAALGAVLVEGVYSLRPELRPFFDVTIWVEAPADLRIERQFARGENSRE